VNDFDQTLPGPFEWDVKMLVASFAVGRGDRGLVPPERSADLRRYYAKHSRTDRLDSQLLAGLPMLRADGPPALDHEGPERTTLPGRDFTCPG